MASSPCPDCQQTAASGASFSTVPRLLYTVVPEYFALDPATPATSFPAHVPPQHDNVTPSAAASTLESVPSPLLRETEPPAMSELTQLRQANAALCKSIAHLCDADAWVRAQAAAAAQRVQELELENKRLSLEIESLRHASDGWRQEQHALEHEKDHLCNDAAAGNDDQADLSAASMTLQEAIQKHKAATLARMNTYM